MTAGEQRLAISDTGDQLEIGQRREAVFRRLQSTRYGVG